VPAVVFSQTHAELVKIFVNLIKRSNRLCKWLDLYKH
jgi:hypothetical protein